jgi:hypothetical protein
MMPVKLDIKYAGLFPTIYFLKSKIYSLTLLSATESENKELVHRALTMLACRQLISECLGTGCARNAVSGELLKEWAHEIEFCRAPETNQTSFCREFSQLTCSGNSSK